MKMFNIFNWVQNLVEAFTFYGGSSGGGGGGSQTSTSYSTNLPEYAKPYYEELLKQTGKQTYTTDAAGNVTGVKPMPTYTGERVAGFTPEQLKVQSEVAGMTRPGGFGAATSGLSTGQTMGFGAGAAGLGQAFGYTPTAIYGGTFTPGAAAYYSSPYQTAVTDIAVREAEKQRDLAKAAGMTGAIGRGTFGGARQALLQAEQGRNAAQQIGDIRAKGAEQGYLNAQQQFQADQARRLQAEQLTQQGQQYAAGLGKDIGLAGITTGIEASAKQAAAAAAQQTADLERLKAQAATGAEKQAYDQKIKDLQYQTFMDQQNYQKQQLEYLSNILRGNAAALGSTQVQYTPQPSTVSQIGGLGLAGLGLAKALG
jgi:hypothetical protein